MSSISMLSEITRGALDPEGWQPLIDVRPDWFEVIHLYGTEGGWNKLKTLVDAHEDADARHQASQKAGEAALAGDQRCVEDARSTFLRRRNIMVEIFRNSRLLPVIPSGASYALVDISPTGCRSLDFAKKFLTTYDTAVVPGITFGGNTASIFYRDVTPRPPAAIMRLTIRLDGPSVVCFEGRQPVR
jgi:hypothetical protein